MELVLSRREQDSPASLAGADFADCYSRELPGLIWFVMSLGASAEMAADVAQSAFADAFPGLGGDPIPPRLVTARRPARVLPVRIA